MKDVIEDVVGSETMDVLDIGEAHPQKLNDAEVLGNSDYDISGFLEQPLVFMTGDLYPKDNRHRRSAPKQTS